MASTLSKLGVPKKLVKVIHNLPDEIEKMRPFTYNAGAERRAELPPIGQNRPSHEVGVMDQFQMKKTKLLGNNYVPKGGNNREKQPGYLADLENMPWGDIRVLLAVPKPGGKYAGEAPRFDYIYHKASAWGKKAQGGGKKYRILTMDADGKILRDWQAYQGDLTYPRDPNNPDAPRRRRNDFKDFPTDANGMIDVYILDPEIEGHETSWQDLGYRGEKKSHEVPIGKARKKKRERTISKFEKADSFIEDFAERFDKILTSIFGKRKEAARQKYSELIAGGEDINTEEMRDLSRVIADNENIRDNLTRYYRNFLRYLNAHGKYDTSDITEILDVDGDDIAGLSASELKTYASITDAIGKHSKMSVLRKLAEFILTGEVDDIHKEMEVAIGGFGEEEEEVSAEDFESMLDYEGIDLEDPFGAE